MGAPLKFTFNTAFGTRSENERLVQDIPTITQDDVDNARTQGFVQGREDGLAEANNVFNADFKSSLDNISTQLAHVISQQSASHHASVDNAEKFALLIAKKIAESAITQYPMVEIKNLISECLSHINDVPHLVIRVNQSVSQLTQDELQNLVEQKGFEGKLIVLGEPDIALGDCLIEWADGGVAHDSQEIVQKINTLLSDYFDFDTDEVIEASVEDENSVANDEASLELLPETKALEVVTEEPLQEEIMPEDIAPEEPLQEEIMPEDIAAEEAMLEEIMPQEALLEEITSEEIINEEIMPHDIMSDEEGTQITTESAAAADLEGQTNE